MVSNKEIVNENKNKDKRDCFKIIEAIGIVIGAICTIIGVWFGFEQIRSVLKEEQFSNRMELAEDLLGEYITLTEYASKSAFYLVAEANGQAEEYSEYADYPNKHIEARENIKYKIIAYGSTELVELYFDTYNSIEEKIKNGDSEFKDYVEYLYSMPLTISCIKYDLTGEKTNPSIFYTSFMEDLKKLEQAIGMENFHDEMISTNNKLVKEYRLPKEFNWKEK